ncbi:Permuted papain-like amidase enzyme, YaeF/YiiX, C92 family [Desulfuromusa kysingii]|uniref:Permuted papain-like amidase enzyme, YaeF/YiiX, C92 family n=1 Tax=Desulfuromusa kysingii TaxID=37625 RepID=A0A1H4DSB2_9BACT|nr:YiiX/YebB-like N1pC/P60 family cysteine hydrolase [Desulfuromusa kysingii]SEA75644.1 Permuted papain-like amidase enzyme, YaeF/YiiX, C92 family [Desulfuromusa kysingii]
MNIARRILEKIGHQLSIYLTKPRSGPAQLATSDPELLAKCLRPGDVLLIDSNSRVGAVIKYLTQSGWSHAALYLGPEKTLSGPGEEAKVLLEADVIEGVRLVPLSDYVHKHTRICRPIGLSAVAIDQILDYAMERLGHSYDLKNIFDLARYFVLPTPVPAKWRRSLLAFGSGDPTRAICSSLIAQAFHSVRYPILPNIRYQKSMDRNGQIFCKQILKIRHHSLFVPGDFDVSPYFQIIKPQIEAGFDPEELDWESSG